VLTPEFFGRSSLKSVSSNQHKRQKLRSERHPLKFHPVWPNWRRINFGYIFHIFPTFNNNKKIFYAKTLFRRVQLCMTFGHFPTTFPITLISHLCHMYVHVCKMRSFQSPRQKFAAKIRHHSESVPQKMHFLTWEQKNAIWKIAVWFQPGSLLELWLRKKCLFCCFFSQSTSKCFVR
jgi:hypothetical protein